MNATDTEAALLAAIRANPGEDAPRLVLADWLEENAGAVECELCKGKGYYSVRERGEYGPNHYQQDCLACKGKGCLSDSRAELAAFIRVQVELAAEHSDCGAKGYGPCGERCEELRRRERELWPAVRGAFEGEGAAKLSPVLGIGGIVGNAPLGLVSRGLPAVVRSTLAEWMGGECATCGGQGWTCDCDPEAAGVETCYCSDYPCESCNGAKRTPGIGPRLAQQWPIERVEVMDKRPAITHVGLSGKLRFTWYGPRASGDTSDESRLPSEIFSALSHVDYDSEPAARSALSDALLAWARGAGISRTARK